MENKRAHLGMIQGVVNRMAGNSFLLKGWTITLVAALFALAQKESNPKFMYLPYFPAIVLWALDAYYLRQERLFRKLYDQVRKKAEPDIDFSMSTRGVQKEAGKYSRALFSKTVLPFYGGLVVAIFVATVISAVITKIK
ncbi:MAG: hypothetical protein ACLQU3_34590 [Limisphaerales bacterium]